MTLQRLYPLLLLLLLSGCGLPYLGKAIEVPSRKVTVTDTTDNPLSNFNLYVFRCTYPGSQFDKVFDYGTQKSSEVILEEKSKVTWKRSGYIQAAPDFYVPYEPEPYWVACVEKAGYQSRRWSLRTRDSSDVTIKLRASLESGPDSCIQEESECGVCRSYEYFFYEEMRYRHPACNRPPTQRSSGMPQKRGIP